ncbi:MAG: glycosyltransferase family 2 protein [Lachnospiraceae bacterium]|nr:glycosyltransferase family 2 protein [Lachnospiraceae bacterium]
MVDLVIPVYKPQDEFVRLLDLINKQTVPIHKIILMNTEKIFWDEFIKHHKEVEAYDNLEIHHISREEFDHGNTRNQGISYSDAEYILLMTQDAIPENEFLVENLLESFENPKVALAYARQLPKEDCREAEKFTRQFNYPSESVIKSEADIETMGIKAFFCSDVCAMYRKEVFECPGGFTKKTIFNEDSIFARGALKKGYVIAYNAKAQVIHSHNYGNMEQFRRNFDLGVSQKQHPQVFEGIKSESEGIKLVKKTIVHLWKNKCKMQILPMIVQSGFKFLGYKFGKNYTKLSKSFVIKCSMNKSYWQ